MKTNYPAVNIKKVIGLGCSHTHKVWREFTAKNLGKYHDFYIKSDALSLTNICENVRDKCNGKL